MKEGKPIEPFDKIEKVQKRAITSTLQPLLLVLAFIQIFASALTVAEAEDRQKLVVAYLPGYATNAKRQYSIDQAPGFLTHLIYGFAGVQDNGGDPATTKLPEPKDVTKNFVKLERYRQRFPQTKIMISIGGWNNSHTGQNSGDPDPTPLFAKISADPVWRKAFVESAMSMFIRRTPLLFDGIDLDWEFPTTAADKANFTLLAQEFRAALDAQSASDGRRYLFSVAVSINPDELDLPQVAKVTDFFNVMAYNFHVASDGPHHANDGVTNFENPLQSVPGDPTPNLNVTSVVDKFLATGVASNKFVLGITSYAHSYAGVPSTNGGLFQSYVGKGPGTFTPGIITLRDIENNYLQKCKLHAAGAWHTSWLYCEQDNVFVSYENVEEVREKAVFADKRALGGMMLWELGADNDAMLIREANAVLNKGCEVGDKLDSCGFTHCNDGTCQAGIVASCSRPSQPVCVDGCSAHGGASGSIGCVKTP